MSSELPDAVRRSMELWAGCVAGALSEDDYRAKLARAGFHDIDLEVTRVYSLEDARGLLGCCSSDTDAIAKQTEGKLVSAFVRARKPITASPASCESPARSPITRC